MQHLSGGVEQGEEAPSRPADSPWHIEQVDTPKHFYEGSSRALALDAFDHPHIAYGGDRLYYAWYDGTTWHLETVDTSQGEVGWYASLALDTFGRPHISYHASAPNFDLRYAYFDGTAWQIEVIDYPSLERISLALDSSGRPHIVYNDSAYLKYASFDGSSWHIETIVRGSGDASLALDAFGRPHVSYCCSAYRPRVRLLRWNHLAYRNGGEHRIRG